MPVSDRQLAEAKHLSLEQVRLLRRSRGTTNDTLNGMPDAAVRRALRRLDHPDMPRLRAEFRLRQARGDDGAVPPPMALGRAGDQLRSALAGGPDRATTAGVPTGRSRAARPAGGPAAGLSPVAWTWLGPGNVGGRTRGIVVHPGTPERMWAASAGGGVWATGDAGGNWAPVDDRLDNLACSCLAMDPTDPDTLYVGTGEPFRNVDAVRGNGLFRTTDGSTWASLPATRTPDFRSVGRIAVSPDGAVLLVAGSTGLLRSADPARAQWTTVLSAQVGDVRFDPTDGQRAVAGGLRTGEAWFSRDGGLSWTPATTGAWTGRVELAHAVRDPSVVYASVEMTSGQIWRSTDGGATYLARRILDVDGRPAEYLGDQGWYSNAIWAGDPTDENLLVTGGVNLWRSTDGGDHLTEISTWWAADSVHADHHAIVSHPGYDGVANRTVLFGNDGGVFRAADLALVGSEPEPPFEKGWEKLVNDYGVTQFYGGAGHSGTGTIVGGAQDNGSLRFGPAAGAQAWTEFFGGDGGWCASDPTDPDVFYGEYVFLNIHRNTDGATTDDTEGDRYISGQFFNPARGPQGEWDWKPAPFRIEDAKTGDTLFIAPFVLDPNDPDRLFGGGLSLWRTDDAKTPNTPTSGPRWRAVKPRTGAEISAIAVTPGNSDAVWVGHVDGAVFRTANGTAATPAWQRVGATGPDRLQPQRYCTRLTVHPARPQTVYACFGGYEAGNLWVTEDGGARWHGLGTALPAAPVRALAVHPQHDRFLYCGTEVGLFASEDGGTSWSPTTEGPNSCPVDDLFWMGRSLVCVTHGRGMFRIDL
ncbi:WD40/YVTN/BNR-like repeat-containing protein [Streptomyces sp. NRRL B-24484]|uniref:WD40/YVTN/BNR-like repeat-containing protein n=1 Tax=Streptomyces sp. NRRL B-24484 TaxID=1463833 RepID=UPI0004C25962|nr:hypothetical protein [Streptomyces sp. NRRL B-24484]